MAIDEGNKGFDLLTIGHGTHSQVELTALLKSAGVESLIDVRRYPGSRRNPDLGRDALTEALPSFGIAYRWEEALGGRRHLKKSDPQLDPWWRVAAFRAYAAHTRTGEFAEAMATMLAEARNRRVVLMCSEHVWWRCHRRLISDVSTLAHDRRIGHVMPDGRIDQHPPAAGARLDANGQVYWDSLDA